jgi:hypothetical protein
MILKAPSIVQRRNNGNLSESDVIGKWSKADRLNECLGNKTDKMY